MKITIFKKKMDGESISTIEFADFIQQVKEGRNGYIDRFRDNIDNIDRPERWEHYDKIQQVCPCAEYFKGKDGNRKFRCYNGISVLKVQELKNTLEVQRIKEQASYFPQTLCAFVGADGLSVIIWTLASLPNGDLPKDEVRAELFGAQAYVTSVQAYINTLDHRITIEAPGIEMRCMFTHDEHPFVNPHPTPFIIDQPTDETLKRIISSRETENRLQRLSPGAESYVTFTHMYNAVCNRLYEEMGAYRRPSNDIGHIECIAKACAEANLPEEEVAVRLINRFYKVDENEVRGAVDAIYSEDRNIGRRASMTKHQLVAYKLREFFERRYDIRFNTMLQMTEYRQRHSFQFMYKELGRRDLNTIYHEANIEGIEASFSEIENYAHSNYIPQYNPIEEYINNIPEWDGKDRLTELADMVPTSTPNWQRLFRQWFLSMVAHWMHNDTLHANATAPILIGAQGSRKSTFWRMLLPPELQEYYTDSIDFRTKLEAERVLSRFLLVNIDEFDQLNDQQFAFIKHLFQKTNTKHRRMYSETISTQRRYTSFAGTSNHQEILRDPTGNRRYLCVEVTAPIHTDRPIDYRQVYAQAKHLIKNGERYWIDDEDEAMIRQSNQNFEVESPLEQLFNRLYTKPEDDNAGEWLLPSEIMQELMTLPTFNKRNDNNVRLLGRILTKLQLKKKRDRRGMQYFVKKLG